MSPRLHPLILFAALVPVTAVAVDPAVNSGAKENPGPYVLKNRSAFSGGGDEQRAPFWPIGWSKRKPVSLTAAPAQQVMEVVKTTFDASTIKVTSILLGTPSLAIINGRSYSEGDLLRQPKGASGPAPRVRVYRISDGQVILQHQTDLIPVTLQRPELVQRSVVEDLLTEDRP